MSSLRPTNRRRLRVLAGCLAVLTALLPPFASTSRAATTRIRATGDDRWRPAHVFIVRGDRIVWRNPTERLHDLYKWKGRWKRGYLDRRLKPDERFVKRFRHTGNYYFRCVRHSSIVDGVCRGMCGIIHVRRP